MEWRHTYYTDLKKHVLDAYNKDECVGALIYEKVKGSKSWYWYQREGTGLSPNCLQEVIDKQNELEKVK